MSVVPGGLDTDSQPPMAVPLRHFVVATGLLLVGLALGLGDAAGVLGGRAGLAHVHVLLAGWVCVTIMGATTQFVPVWSGVELHSRRLATAQLWLVTAGVLGVAGVLLAGESAWLAVPGGVLLAGFWTFAYNLGRTLPPVAAHDVTERYFALAVTALVVVAGLGFLLALDFRAGVFADLPVTRAATRQAHATLAVFGVVLGTVLGALSQLLVMFTQTDFRAPEVTVRRVERVAYPVGVACLAGGRLVGSAPVARAGGVLVAGTLAAFAVVLARRLRGSAVEWTPMLWRYAVAAPALAGWAVLALPAWLAEPLDPAAVLGAPGTVHLLVVGAVGFVVWGTLYHVVPFVVWVHRYSDVLGREPVPMVDDLYRDDLAALDGVALVAGTALLVVAEFGGLGAAVTAVGGGLVFLGAAVFAANLAVVLRDHSPHTIREVVVGPVGAGVATGDGPATEDPETGGQ